MSAFSFRIIQIASTQSQQPSVPGIAYYHLVGICQAPRRHNAPTSLKNRVQTLKFRKLLVKQKRTEQGLVKHSLSDYACTLILAREKSSAYTEADTNSFLLVRRWLGFRRLVVVASATTDAAGSVLLKFLLRPADKREPRSTLFHTQSDSAVSPLFFRVRKLFFLTNISQVFLQWGRAIIHCPFVTHPGDALASPASSSSLERGSLITLIAYFWTYRIWEQTIRVDIK